MGEKTRKQGRTDKRGKGLRSTERKGKTPGDDIRRIIPPRRVNGAGLSAEPESANESLSVHHTGGFTADLAC